MGDTLQITKIVFKKSSFDKIPENERVFMVQFSMFANEISMLHKFIVFSNYHLEDERIQTAQNVQSFFLLKLLAGKLSEGYQIVQKSYFGKQLSKEYDSLLPENSNRALSSLKSYFVGDNLIRKIRNKYAFHSDMDPVREQFGAIPDDEELDIYLASDHGNSLYSMDHIISSYALFNEMDSSDHFQALDRIFKEILEVASNFLTFANGVLVEIWAKYRIHLESITEIDLEGIQNVNSVKLPFFVSR